MDVTQFLQQLLEALSSLPFVREVDLKTEVFILKGRVFLENNCFLQVYFNARTGTIAFALIKGEKRLWGIDFDSLRAWHVHPMENPDAHLNTEPKNVKEIISEFSKVWKVLFP